MKIAIVGCGFVADYYLSTLPFHPQLELVGVTDKLPERIQKFSEFHSIPTYESLDALLADPQVNIVLNLTNPRNHFEVSKAALEAGKHVYSEKPLAMAIDDAKALVALAAEKGLHISSAPCSALSETAQTVWKALREHIIGKVYLVYAEMDDGLVHTMPYQQWLSTSGMPWPHKDEFEVGCTLEHAGYYVNWLTMFFGPAQSVTAFSSCLVKDKVQDVVLEPDDTPDFSVACIQFQSGIVARLTCSIVATHDHQLRIFGQDGVLSIHDCWNYGDPVYVQRMLRIRRKVLMNPFKQKVPLVRKPPKFKTRGAQKMDFCRGVAEMADAIAENRPSRMAADVSLHNNELAIAIQDSLATGAPYQLTTTFEPIQPMAWSK
ncbi:MAG: Gfo/Idh/MocA family oxidoreductase [Leptolyngbya sp. SIOISBB]|nr:Gfo/Idh/MocA family oxidoreductase [Leptolyngbya sp. SIOISBB]